MNRGDLVLNKRYELTTKIDMPGMQSSELWEATNKDGELQTLKTSPYFGEKPTPEVRRVWDNDMRVMYRLSSSAGAHEQLVVMKDAGIDYAAHAMILVYEGWNYISLAQMIEKRNQLNWLSFKKLKDQNVRRELWYALHKLACGLSLLHDQHLIHRNVLSEAIWGCEGEGPESLRLSGFDWSARLGHVASTSMRAAWSTPPELENVGYSFASDWYGYGTTVARCFYHVECLGTRSAEELATGLTATILRENHCQLSDLERNFIRALVAPNRFDRLQRSSEILSGIENIIEALDIGLQSRKSSRSVLFHVDCKSPKMIEAVQDSGFVVNPDDPFEPFNPDSPKHRTQLKDFLSSQLRHSSLVWKRDRSQFEINCGNLFVVCEKWINGSTREQSWEVAKAKWFNRTSSIRDPAAACGFNDARIEVEFGVREVYSKISSNADYASWDIFAPKEGIPRRLGRDSEHLQQFFHASNQFEVLLRDAELYKYKIIPSFTSEQNGFMKIAITEVAESRHSRDFFNANKKLTEFLQQELDSGKNDSDKALLTESDSLFVSRAGSGTSSARERFDVDKEQWRVVDVDHENEVVFLERGNQLKLNPPPKEGYVRTRGHYGQIRLIERRKNSIDRLASHSYLLRAMAMPNLTRIDAGESPLPFPQIEQNENIDENKIAIVKDILRTRPTYGLQGPPGTGKSTLVAHLLRQILEEDPMAQILVTAKDHNAVDNLIDKVISKAYEDVPKEQIPLAVRLARRDGSDHAEVLVKELTHNALAMLKNHSPQLGNRDYRQIQDQWIRILEGLNDYIDKRDDSEQCNAETSKYLTIFESIRNLVRQGASITYSTTSSGDLEELAKGSHSFDWSIIEEAGKTHGFDLALPLQAGHRWLLLGDHKQLSPFLYDEFVKCVDRLEDAISVLEEIKNKRGNDRLVDIEWIKMLLDSENLIVPFKNFANTWLASFATIFEKLTKIKGAEEITQTDSIGASAGRLSIQYRMPPVVGDLISSVFYNNQIKNGTATVEGKPDDDHSNPFVDPPWINGQTLVWLDTPWKAEYESIRRTGYSNNAERQTIIDLLKSVSVAADLQPLKHYTVAILTPYNMQKYEINSAEVLNMPSGCQFGSSQDRSGNAQKAYSVDSFQGNEGDIVVVSLVRNELSKRGFIPSASDIEFITQPDRLNVMLSRSVRLLVIVGCWDYLSKCVESVSSAKNEEGDFIDRKFGPFKKTLETLEQFFKDGRALKISANEVSR